MQEVYETIDYPATHGIYLNLPKNDTHTHIVELRPLQFNCTHVWDNIIQGFNDTLTITGDDTYEITPGNYELADLITQINTDISGSGVSFSYTEGTFVITMTGGGLDDTRLSRMLGFTVKGGTATAGTNTYMPNVHLSSVRPYFIVTNDILESTGGLYDDASNLNKRKIWFMVELDGTYKGCRIKTQFTNDENNGRPIMLNKSNMVLKFYWPDGSLVDFGNSLAHLEFQVLRAQI